MVLLDEAHGFGKVAVVRYDHLKDVALESADESLLPNWFVGIIWSR